MRHHYSNWRDLYDAYQFNFPPRMKNSSFEEYVSFSALVFVLTDKVKL